MFIIKEVIIMKNLIIISKTFLCMMNRVVQNIFKTFIRSLMKRKQEVV